MDEFLPEAPILSMSESTAFPLHVRLASLPNQPPLAMALETAKGGDYLLLSVCPTHWYDGTAAGGILEKFGQPEDFEYRISEDQMLDAVHRMPCPAVTEKELAAIRKFV